MTGLTPLLPSVLGAMETSPLVDLSRFCAAHGLDGAIYAKLDYLLPGHSKKDRAARQTIVDAKADGSLAPGQTVVELTSGNMGTGLAIVCAVEGHPFVATMSAGNSPERARMMRALGAEVVLVEQVDGTPGNVTGADLAAVEKTAQRLTAERKAFRADQFVRPANVLAHASGTASEIWAQSDGHVTAFCDLVGSGGTLGGVAQALTGKGVACYAVEPQGAEVLGQGDTSQPAHPIQGGGYGMAELAHLDRVDLAGTVVVSGAEAIATARDLARTEGIFGGFSGGANVAAAAKLLAEQEKGGVIAALICDSGMKYLSTELWA